MHCHLSPTKNRMDEFPAYSGMLSLGGNRSSHRWNYRISLTQAFAMGKEHLYTRFLKPRLNSVTQWLWVAVAVIGFSLLGAGALRAQRILASQGWPETDGVVVTSDLQRGVLREGGLKYQYQILYRYTVNGTTYQSKRLSFGGRKSDHSSGQLLLSTYPNGHLVSVHYNPTNPALAVLETGRSWRGFQQLVYGMVLACLGVAGFWRRWPMQSDYLFRERDPDQPLTYLSAFLGTLGLLTCLGIAWIWWELIKMYAGR